MRPSALSSPIQIAEDVWGDATQFQWFDCEKLRGVNTRTDGEWLTTSQLPFEKCAIFWPMKTTKITGCSAILFLKSEGDRRVGVYTIMVFADGGYVPFAPFSYDIQNDDVRIWLSKEDQDTQLNARNCMIVLNEWFGLLAKGAECYELTVQKSSKNQRRIAKGKRPMYDWRTVVIGAAKSKSEPQGGHHAPPRQHDRRGHLRRYKSGKTVWVRATKVGKASDGFVFHDYAVG